MKRERAIGVDLNVGENAGITIDNLTDRLKKNFIKTYAENMQKIITNFQNIPNIHI